ncbi:MAG: hypothetical protein PHR79_05350 [Bacteroidales bacterium]|nr:hypothetical protein [Bacteroidales bacterium]
MKEITKDTINQRFKIAVNLLIKEKLAKNKAEIAEKLNSSPQKFSEILNNRMNVSIEMISRSVIEYQINPYYILTGDGDVMKKYEESCECTHSYERDERIKELKDTIAILKNHIQLLNESKNEDATNASVADVG